VSRSCSMVVSTRRFLMNLPLSCSKDRLGLAAQYTMESQPSPADLLQKKKCVASIIIRNIFTQYYILSLKPTDNINQGNFLAVHRH
jgi:hypothetical protein